jgi:hypothetical protein
MAPLKIIANRSYENVSQFKYLETTVTNQNLIQKEIKRRLNSGNACYHSVQNFLSSRLLSKNLKIRIYKAIILPVILYGCETYSLTLREKLRLRVFENRVLRRIFGPKRSWSWSYSCGRQSGDQLVWVSGLSSGPLTRF